MPRNFDPLGPARGLLLGLLIALIIWGGLIWAVVRLFR